MPKAKPKVGDVRTLMLVAAQPEWFAVLRIPVDGRPTIIRVAIACWARIEEYLREGKTYKWVERLVGVINHGEDLVPADQLDVFLGYSGPEDAQDWEAFEEEPDDVTQLLPAGPGTPPAPSAPPNPKDFNLSVYRAG